MTSKNGGAIMTSLWNGQKLSKKFGVGNEILPVMGTYKIKNWFMTIKVFLCFCPLFFSVRILFLYGYILDYFVFKNFSCEILLVL